MRQGILVPFLIILCGIVVVMAGAPVWIAFVGVAALLTARFALTVRRLSARPAVAAGVEVLPFESLPKQSIKRRAMLAVLLTFGFYALALTIVALLVGAIFLDMASGHLHFQLLFIAIAGTWGILSGIIPREQKFVAPGPRLTPEAQPRLFEKIQSIAGKAGQAMPHDVYLIPDLNAWVADIGSGNSTRRVMGIGLPLLQLLDVSQFSAVVAHEFGHYYGGDTQLGPWIYKTRGAIGRTLTNLAQSSVGGVRAVVNAPFRAYGNMFMNVTQAVSRQQEYTADRFAAAIASPRALMSALKQINGYAPAVARYWHGLLEPALAAGRRPPITAGLERIATSATVSELAASLTEKIVKEAQENPMDTHPPLRDRLAALEALPAGEETDTAAAVTLLDDLPKVEDDLLAALMPAESVGKLESMAWEDAAESVFMADWRNLRDRNRQVLAGWTVNQVPQMLPKADELGPRLVGPEGEPVPKEAQRILVLFVIKACLALAMRDAGWTFVAVPEQMIGFKRGDDYVDLNHVVQMLVSGQTYKGVAQKWDGFCDHLGITGMPMAGAQETHG